VSTSAAAAAAAQTNSITITTPDDWHLHVRDGDNMRSVVPHSAAHFGRAIIMPNLVPPVTSVKLVSEGGVLAAVCARCCQVPSSCFGSTYSHESSSSIKEGCHIQPLRLSPGVAGAQPSGCKQTPPPVPASLLLLLLLLPCRRPRSMNRASGTPPLLPTSPPSHP
jgi:hypothetical protein